MQVRAQVVHPKFVGPCCGASLLLDDLEAALEQLTKIAARLVKKYDYQGPQPRPVIHADKVWMRQLNPSPSPAEVYDLRCLDRPSEVRRSRRGQGARDAECDPPQ